VIGSFFLYDPSDGAFLLEDIRMKVLVVEDDAVQRVALEGAVKRFGHNPVVAEDGEQAWDAFTAGADLRVVLTDWLMPTVDGIELCRRIRRQRQRPYTYILMLTIKKEKSEYLEGMEAGVDDFMTKPFDVDELEARLGVAERILGLRVELDRLTSLLPICAYCKDIQDDRSRWMSVEQYVTSKTDTDLTHTICPSCFESEVKPELEELKRTSGRSQS
jgi:CheY-like chemotaxis protein